MIESGRLTSREREVLEFEQAWQMHGSHKQDAIRAHFGFTPSHYYVLLGRALARSDAEDFDPLLVRRLRRRRAARASSARVGLEEQVSPPRGRRMSK